MFAQSLINPFLSCIGTRILKFRWFFERFLRIFLQVNDFFSFLWTSWWTSETVIIRRAERWIKTAQIIKIIMLHRGIHLITDLIKPGYWISLVSTLKINNFSISGSKLAHYQMHFLPNSVQSSLLRTFFSKWIFSLTLLIQLFHNLLNGIIYEKKRKQSILWLYNFE